MGGQKGPSAEEKRLMAEQEKLTRMQRVKAEKEQARLIEEQRRDLAQIQSGARGRQSLLQAGYAGFDDNDKGKKRLLGGG